MNKRFYWIIFAFGLLATSLQAQQVLSPREIHAFGPIPVQKPVLLDSVNLKETPFSDELLLAYSISFPDHDRFTTKIIPDTAGYFNLPGPAQGHAFQLLSFYLSADRYGKGKITVTSPNRLELWINNVKRATKKEVNDSLHNAGSVDTGLNGFTNNVRVVIKMLTSAESMTDPAVKIELKADEADSLLTYTFNNINQRRINIKDIVEGTRVNNASISPGGRFLLLSLRETLPGGSNRSYTEIYDTKQ